MDHQDEKPQIRLPGRSRLERMVDYKAHVTYQIDLDWSGLGLTIVVVALVLKYLVFK